MTEFGDFDPDDALDTEPADPEQVARKLHRYRQEDEPMLANWDELDAGERVLIIGRITRLLAWMKRQGATP